LSFFTGYLTLVVAILATASKLYSAFGYAMLGELAGREAHMKENPFPQWPRGLPRTLAAEYIGVSLPLFDKLVLEGQMPKAETYSRSNDLGSGCRWSCV
jgi:hypothetical protein